MNRALAALACAWLGLGGCRCDEPPPLPPVAPRPAPAPDAGPSGEPEHPQLGVALRAIAEGRHADARRRLEPLAERELALAQLALANLLDEGLGGPADPARAAHWYTRAADAQLPDAQLGLGLLCLQGRGVPQDDIKAYLWLSLAARGGREAEARPHLATLEARMPAAQVRKARQTLNLVRNLEKGLGDLERAGPRPALDPRPQP